MEFLLSSPSIRRLRKLIGRLRFWAILPISFKYFSLLKIPRRFMYLTSYKRVCAHSVPLFRPSKYSSMFLIQSTFYIKLIFNFLIRSPFLFFLHFSFILHYFFLFIFEFLFRPSSTLSFFFIYLVRTRNHRACSLLFLAITGNLYTVHWLLLLSEWRTSRCGISFWWIFWR